MSLSYVLFEKFCFFANRVSRGSFKQFIINKILLQKKKYKLPGNLSKGKFKTETISLHGFTIYRIEPKQLAETANSAVLFLAGGGGMANASKIHYAAVKRVSLQAGVVFYIANYPLAPEYNVRFALGWLEKVYAELLNKYKLKKIILMGDSAGSNLILSLTQRLKEKPEKLIVVSPACGLEDGRNRDIRLEMEKYDPILSVEMNDTIAKKWCKSVPLNSPDISPEYIDYTGFPPMYFFYGEHELFYPHVRNLLNILREKKVDFKERTEPMCHDWAFCGFFPEGRRAMQEMGEWIKNCSDLAKDI